MTSCRSSIGWSRNTLSTTENEDAVKIEGSTIIVTGGASGIGLAMAAALHDAGAFVWALDRDATALDTMPVGERFVARRCDVGCEEDVVRTIAAIDEQSGGIDALVNNAAVLRDQALVSRLKGRVRRHSLDDWNETLTSNLTGTFLAAREVAAAMVNRGRRGVLVNVSSVSRHGNAGQSAYAASKAGIDALTVTWSRELSVYDIRVAAIAPGFVRTPMTDRIPPMFLERIREQTPLKRFGEPDEFAHAITFVLENDYLNGTVLELDGGLRFS